MIAHQVVPEPLLSYIEEQYPHADVLNPGRNESDLPDDGNAIVGVRNALILEALFALMCWGAWELFRWMAK